MFKKIIDVIFFWMNRFDHDSWNSFLTDGKNKVNLVATCNDNTLSMI